MPNEIMRKAPITRNAQDRAAKIPRNLPTMIDLLPTGLHNKVIRVPFSRSFAIVLVVLKEARQRQHIKIVETPISFIILTSSPKANKVKKKEQRMIRHPPPIIMENNGCRVVSLAVIAAIANSLDS